MMHGGNMIKHIVKGFLAGMRERTIRKNAIVGKDVRFYMRSSCINTGGRKNVRIGDHVCMFGSISALYGGRVSIGSHCYIGGGTTIQASDSVEIGDHVIIAGGVRILDNNIHPVDPQQRLRMTGCADYLTDDLWTWKHARHAPVIIRENVWIGQEAVIMKGVTVGRGAVVGMRAVVTHDVPEYTVVAGNPARVVKSLKPAEQK